MDFWRLVWQEKACTIVMIINITDELRRINYPQYWPDSGAQMFGPFQVTFVDRQIFAHYIIRILLVQVCVSFNIHVVLT